MKEYAAFFASGVVLSFHAHNDIFAEAHAHRYAVDKVEYLEAVVEVVPVEYVEEAA